MRLTLARSPKDASAHFSDVAEVYHDLRTTDQEPIISIKNQLRHLLYKPSINAADIGCGNGRYSLLLPQHLGDRLRLTFADKNRCMLNTLTKRLDHTRSFEVIQSSAECIPVCEKSFDFATAFNAAHHFKLKDFLAEMARILKDEGLLFIYTRTQEQNRCNIWGKYFPDFCKKETRLWKERDFYRVVAQTSQFALQDSVYFTYRRVSSLERLIEQAEGHHYSTFWFYSDKSFREALNRFKQNITAQFTDPAKIQWTDENTLFVLKKIREAR